MISLSATPMRHRHLLVLLALAAACAPSRPQRSSRSYVPRRRTVVITAVPLLVKEQTGTFPFLARDFAAGGVLSGKEVYAFSPSTITVVAGDTLALRLLNPEDDDHAFAMSDFYVKLPPQGKVDTTYVARSPGVFEFSCTVPAHLPMMRGQLVVLAPGALEPNP
ncbi:MAG TPA: cupredoxin domain-containing protein [Gemmatimonadaceae bacterium]|nr:cupredoxin domain-containing protein [Gemmatimonadaceae bacterium]